MIGNLGVDLADHLILAAGTCPRTTCWTDKGVNGKPHVASVTLLLVKRLNPGAQVAAVRRLVHNSNVSTQKVRKSAPLLFQQALEGFENHTRDLLAQAFAIVAAIRIGEFVMEEMRQGRVGSHSRACWSLWLHSRTSLPARRWSRAVSCRPLIVQVNKRRLRIIEINERNIVLIRGVGCIKY